MLNITTTNRPLYLAIPGVRPHLCTCKHFRPGALKLPCAHTISHHAFSYVEQHAQYTYLLATCAVDSTDLS